MTKNITVSDETHERLKKYGEFGDTFDDLICKILNRLDDCESDDMGGETEVDKN